MAGSARRGFWNANEQSMHRSQLRRAASRSKVCAGSSPSLPQSGHRTYRSMNESGTFTDAIPHCAGGPPEYCVSSAPLLASDTFRLDLEAGLIGVELPFAE